MRNPSYTATVVSICLMLPIHCILPFARFYLLRHRRQTPALIVSHIFMVLFVTVGAATTGMMLYQIIQENRAAQKFSGVLLLFEVFDNPVNGKLWYTEAALFTLLLWLAKGAFLSLYCGLTHRLSPWVKWSLYVTVFYTLASFVACMGVYLGICQPIEKNWVPQTQRGSCTPASVNIKAVNLQFATNFSTHVLIAIFPFAIFRSYSLASREKIGLAFIFALAIISITISCLRYGIMRQLIGRVREGQTDLMFEYITYQDILGIAELTSANMAFCLPSFRGIMAHLRRPQWSMGSAVRSRKDSFTASQKNAGGLEIAVTRDFEVRVSSYSNDASALSALGLIGLDSDYKASAYRCGLRRSTFGRNDDQQDPKLLARGEDTYVLDTL